MSQEALMGLISLIIIFTSGLAGGTLGGFLALKIYHRKDKNK